jgi:nucleoside-diphosphate-sugar epimerase
MDEKTHLVLGGTGSIGRGVVKTLSDMGLKSRVMFRNKSKVEKMLYGLENVDLVEGDASNPESVLKALDGASSLFYCINIPYPEWKGKAKNLLDISITAAVKTNAKLIFTGNVYVYGLARYNPVDEKHPKKPIAKKGVIRLEMEESLKRASEKRGLKYAIIRMPDFYGPYVINGFSEKIFMNALQGKPLQWIGDKGVETEYIYIEDAAKATVDAGLSEKSTGLEYNVPACSPITTGDFLERIVSMSGKNSKIKILNSNLTFTLLGLFNPMIHEVKEMLYLKRKRLILDGKLYEKTFGEIPKTSYDIGIKKTLSWATLFYKIMK